MGNKEAARESLQSLRAAAEAGGVKEALAWRTAQNEFNRRDKDQRAGLKPLPEAIASLLAKVEALPWKKCARCRRDYGWGNSARGLCVRCFGGHEEAAEKQTDAKSRAAGEELPF